MADSNVFEITPAGRRYVHDAMARGAVELPTTSPLMGWLVDDFNAGLATGTIELCEHHAAGDTSALRIWPIGGPQEDQLVCEACRVPPTDTDPCGRCWQPLGADGRHVVSGSGRVIIEGRVCGSCLRSEPFPGGDAA